MKKFIYTVFNQQSKPIEFKSKCEEINNSSKDVDMSTKKVNSHTEEENDQSEKQPLPQPQPQSKETEGNKHNIGEEEEQEQEKEDNKANDEGNKVAKENNIQNDNNEETSTSITKLDPTPGMEFDSLTECRQFCVDFSKRNGFLLVTHNSSHKKGYLIMECVYHRKYRNAKKKKVPAAEEENKVAKKTRIRTSKRKGCNCRIVFNRRSKSQKFTLTSMFLEHNHPLPTN